MASDKIRVKVQYIQRHSIEQQSKISNSPVLESGSAAAQEDEVENVEYLDECTGEEYAPPPKGDCNSAIDALDEDAFYSNAVHCLIALYQLQYEQLEGKSAQQLRAMRIWESISSDMKESYFDFSGEQVRRKFTKLRLQYFGISCKEDIEAFYFFSNMHDIYNDKRVAAILRGETDTTAHSVRYDDDELYLANENSEGGEVPSAENKPVTSEGGPQQDAITHKEHEFIDLVEKELQAMDQAEASGSDSIVTSRTLPPSATQAIHLSPMLIKRERDELVEKLSPATNTKRVKLTTPDKAAKGCGSVPSMVHPQVVGKIVNLKPQIDLRNVKIALSPHSVTETAKPHAENEHCHPPKRVLAAESCVSPRPIQESPVLKLVNGQINATEMSLATYNAAQQRRHEEKMEMLRQNLQLQERIAKQQHQLLEELIKRV